MQLKQMTFALKVVMKFQVTFQGFFFFAKIGHSCAREFVIS